MNVDPPFWVAWNQATASIRVRFARHLVTAAGIGLGIAFFAAVQAWSACNPAKEELEAQKLQWLAATSLLMCLVGVANSMLISVSERYREIGTIKCLGASDGFVVKVFFLEALLLGIAGSLAGSSLAVLIVGALAGFRVVLLQVVAIATGLGIAMTVLAAIAPAVQAARMPAVEALRVEI